MFPASCMMILRSSTRNRWDKWGTTVSSLSSFPSWTASNRAVSSPCCFPCSSTWCYVRPGTSGQRGWHVHSLHTDGNKGVCEQVERPLCSCSWTLLLLLRRSRAAVTCSVSGFRLLTADPRKSSRCASWGIFVGLFVSLCCFYFHCVLFNFCCFYSVSTVLCAFAEFFYWWTK